MASVGTNIQELIDRHYDSLYRYAYRLSGSQADADDLTQETFGKAMNRLDQLREVEKARGWLFRILRNVYLRRVQDDRRRRCVPIESLGDLEDRSSPEPPVVDPTVLQTALNELEESFRTPLILFYFEDFSYRDIAEHMDLPIGTVMSRLARAKAYLRSRLSPPDA